MLKLKIWHEGKLMASLSAIRFNMDPEALHVEFGQEFNRYGIFVDAGTGRDTPIGNPGDIGRPKIRQRRAWFNPKYYMSYRNIMEFFAESVSRESVDIICNALDPDKLRNSIK